LTDTVPWHFRISHSRQIDADPEDVWQALTEVPVTDNLLARAMMIVRSLPARVLGKDFQVGESMSMLDQTRQRFSIVTWAEPERIELARIAKFWRPVPVDAPKVRSYGEFAQFHEAGYAKALMGFELQPRNAGTLLTTTTKISATDFFARIKFGVYWAGIRPGAAVIRQALLTATERRALEIRAQRGHGSAEV
jgi:uncharacterized protein YndB with AHSA1/START domain